MKISFNLISCGLANNGGSQTIIKSANMLQKLGNVVTIVDSGQNKNTWNPLECNYIKVKDLKDYPSGDAVIATGYRTVDSTVKLPERCGKKYHYIRLFENYLFDEVGLRKIMKAPTKKIVNSICLQRKLLEYDEKSVIIRPGHDFNQIYPIESIRNKKNGEIILGGLYNEGSKRKNKRTEWVYEVYRCLKNEGKNVKLFMFGSDGIPKFHTDYYVKDPDIKLKNEILNKIDIWLSPSCLEGLHIAPAEAMLTECCVVGNNSDQSGTEDYLMDHETGLVSENNFLSFLVNVQILIKHKIMRIRFGKSGRQKILSLGDREINMKRMMEFLKNDL